MNDRIKSSISTTSSSTKSMIDQLPRSIYRNAAFDEYLRNRMQPMNEVTEPMTIQESANIYHIVPGAEYDTLSINSGLHELERERSAGGMFYRESRRHIHSSTRPFILFQDKPRSIYSPYRKKDTYMLDINNSSYKVRDEGTDESTGFDSFGTPKTGVELDGMGIPRDPAQKDLDYFINQFNGCNGPNHLKSNSQLSFTSTNSGDYARREAILDEKSAKSRPTTTKGVKDLKINEVDGNLSTASKRDKSESRDSREGSKSKDKNNKDAENKKLNSEMEDDVSDSSLAISPDAGILSDIKEVNHDQERKENKKESKQERDQVKVENEHENKHKKKPKGKKEVKLMVDKDKDNEKNRNKNNGKNKDKDKEEVDATSANLNKEDIEFNSDEKESNSSRQNLNADNPVMDKKLKEKYKREYKKKMLASRYPHMYVRIHSLFLAFTALLSIIFQVIAIIFKAPLYFLVAGVWSGVYGLVLVILNGITGKAFIKYFCQ